MKWQVVQRNANRRAMAKRALSCARDLSSAVLQVGIMTQRSLYSVHIRDELSSGNETASIRCVAGLIRQSRFTRRFVNRTFRGITSCAMRRTDGHGRALLASMS